MIEISHPIETLYWIVTAGETPVAGRTEPDQVTSFGPMWRIMLQTTDEAKWLAECRRLGIGEPEEPTM